jgi:chromosome segregation ATPase
MSNLIAKLGLDSKEFKAGLNGAKAATGGFQGTIKSATNDLRGMFDTVLKPVAVVTAAIYALHRAMNFVNDIMTVTADKMRDANGEGLSKSLDAQKESIRALASGYKNLNDEINGNAESQAKTLKVVEDSAEASLKLRRAQALLADEQKTGGKNRDKIELAFDKEKIRYSESGKQIGIGMEKQSIEEQLASKKSQAEELRAQAQEAQRIKLQSQSEAAALQQEKQNLIDSAGGENEIAKKLTDSATGGIFKKELDKREQALRKAQESAKQALEIERSMNDEALKLERDYTYGSIALKELRTKAETEAINSIADQLDKNASRLNALGGIRGQGVETDSMARVGGFLGGERPGLAVADKQLQVAQEMLTLQKENKVLMDKLANPAGWGTITVRLSDDSGGL